MIKIIPSDKLYCMHDVEYKKYKQWGKKLIFPLPIVALDKSVHIDTDIGFHLLGTHYSITTTAKYIS